VGAANVGATRARSPEIEELLKKARHVNTTPIDRYSVHVLFGEKYDEANRARRGLLKIFHEDVLPKDLSPTERRECKPPYQRCAEIWDSLHGSKVIPTRKLPATQAATGIGGDLWNFALDFTNSTLKTARQSIERKLQDGSLDRAVDAVAARVNRTWQDLVAR